MASLIRPKGKPMLLSIREIYIKVLKHHYVIGEYPHDTIRLPDIVIGRHWIYFRRGVMDENVY